MAGKKKASKAQKATGGKGLTKSAESFLKDGPQNAAKALKKNAQQASIPLSRLPKTRSSRPRQFKQARFKPRARADPRLAIKEPVAQSKHETYYEIVENTEKKKKLEYTVTRNYIAPPGFTFIPLGNPELTQACKEISRNTDCMIFVVSTTGEKKTDILSDHLNRIGYHFRSSIVDEASTKIPVSSIRRNGVHVIETYYGRRRSGEQQKEPLPETQEEINAQADAALRDLFPRIPNTDRQEIIDHAFQLGSTFLGKLVVGIQEEVPFYRRVQLAVLAHIRHTHTRYDKLLRETDWATARATVEAACLETLVKWRGDEETGRDQMDEILREIVVISDSEYSDSDDSADDEDDDMEEGEVSEDESDPDVEMVEAQPPSIPSNQQPTMGESSQQQVISLLSPPKSRTTRTDLSMDTSNHQDTGMDNTTKRDRQAQRNERKGFKRYQAWNEAINRHQDEPGPFSKPQDNFGNGTVYREVLNGHNSPNLPLHPGNTTQRQSLDQGRRLQTTPPHKAGEFVDLTESPYGRKLVSRALAEGPSRFSPHEQRDIRYERREFPQTGQHASMVRDGASSSLQQMPLAKSNLQDYLLPSIEQAPDRALDARQNLYLPPRPSEVSPRQTLGESSRGLPLMSDGTYRDAHGVVRTQDGRRVIYIDDDNREVTRDVDSLQRYASKFGEASSVATISSGTVASTSYHRDSVNVDGHSHSYFSTVRNPRQANGDSHPTRPVLLEGRDDPREVSDSRYRSSLNLQPEPQSVERHSQAFYVPKQQGIISKEPEVRRPTFRETPESYVRAPQSYVRAPTDSSRFVHQASPSGFSDKNYGLARTEQFSHSSSQLRERAVYNPDDFDEPILISETKGGTAVRYLQEPSIGGARTYYEQSLPHRPVAFTSQYGSSSQRPEVEYTGLNRSVRDNDRNIQDRHPNGSFGTGYGGVPIDRVGIPTYEQAAFANTRSPLPRKDVAGHNYNY